MNITGLVKWTGMLLCVFALGACGGSDDGGSSTGAQPAGTVIGAAGGTVVGPNGAQVVIPPGALTVDTTIAIEATTTGSPALPGTFFSALGQMFAFTPHGTSFAVPVTVTLPFDPALVPAGQAPALFKTNAQSQWEPVIGAAFGTATVSAQVTSFSWVQVGGLLRNDPVREWEFQTFPGNGEAAVSLGGIRTALVGEFVEEIEDFGPLQNDTPVMGSTASRQPDGRANGYVLSTANGVTYAVAAQAPDGHLGTEQPIGSSTRFKQTQSYIKLTSDATLSFTLSGLSINIEDFNPSSQDEELILIDGETVLSVKAYLNQSPGVNFFSASSVASVAGHGRFWTPLAEGDGLFRRSLWSLGDFEFVTTEITFQPPGGNTTCIGTEASLELRTPRTYRVDLSSVGVGEEFTLEVNTFAQTSNRRGGGVEVECQRSYAHAFLRDPLTVGGTSLEFTGLDPTDRPVTAPQTRELVAPAACVPGPGPNAASGVLQFGTASFAVDEWAGAPPSITVTRTGGSSGAVTATFTTSNGTAIGGVDYTPVNATVFFADGEAGQKVITVPIVLDQIDEIDKTVNLTLSQPGGCAALGVQTSAVLTIRDDDLPPTLPSGLDTTFGIGGRATTTAFGGDRSSMALQADGKIVMVGGTFTDFVLARFNADGSLDTGFGAGGKVTTDMGSGLRSEEATGVAIQSDGKIVVVGYTSIPNVPPAPRLPDTFALARYNADGSLDTSFGTGGRVSGNVNGQAYAVAIQGDGKIVVAGEFSLASTSGSDFSDFTVARFNTNGSLDATFGTSGTGQVVTDIGTATNSARNLVLQPNGAIVVSGKPQGSSPGFDHTDMARYNTNGTLDTSFGTGGRLTFAGVDVGQGLARQADGKFVLAGSVTEATVPATARFLLKRLNADGGADTAFGNAGTVDTAFSSSAAAGGVALQGDGKILVVGASAFSVNANFVVARYNASGSVDRGFGSDGNLSIDFFGFTDVGENVLVQPDGKIVVGGLARNNVDGYGLARIVP